MYVTRMDVIIIRTPDTKMTGKDDPALGCSDLTAELKLLDVFKIYAAEMILKHICYLFLNIHFKF